LFEKLSKEILVMKTVLQNILGVLMIFSLTGCVVDQYGVSAYDYDFGVSPVTVYSPASDYYDSGDYFYPGYYRPQYYYYYNYVPYSYSFRPHYVIHGDHGWHGGHGGHGSHGGHGGHGIHGGHGGHHR
jgi:hypothetical protein